MSRIDIVNIDRDHKKHWQIILGAFLVVAGIIILFPYIITFAKIFGALILIALGLYVLSKNKKIKDRLFFRF